MKADDEPSFLVSAHYAKTLMALALRNWEIASYAMFVYTAILAGILRNLAPKIRARALAGSAAGLVVTTASALTPSNVLLHGWLLPPLPLLLAYWTSGLLYTAPMPRVEQALRQIDRVLGVREISSDSPRWIA